jgi:glycerate dehydrogenase
MTTRIVVLDGQTLAPGLPGDPAWSVFEKLGPCTVYPRTHPGEVAQRAAGAAAVLANKALLPAPVLALLPELRYVGVLATGTNNIDLAAARARGVTVTNVPAYSSDAVAQQTIALLLELVAQVGAYDRAVHQGRWSACPDFTFALGPTMELAGKTLGIVGLGAIGSRVAQVGAALGMRVLAWARPGQKRGPTGSSAIARVTLDDLFAEADVVSLHCPLTPETRCLVNAARLARMKRGALLLNTSRGGLIDEAALAAALRDGTLGGAGLDVLSIEPPAPDNPLVTAPRCVITPHTAWAAVEARQRLMTQAAENLRCFLAGNPVNVVN